MVSLSHGARDAARAGSRWRRAGLLCLWLLGSGRKHFRRSLGQEQTPPPGAMPLASTAIGRAAGSAS